MNMPESIWKSYIDMEISLQEHDKARELYERLLSKTKHVKVWMSFAQFEFNLENYNEMRQVFNDAERYLKENPDLKEVKLRI